MVTLIGILGTGMKYVLDRTAKKQREADERQRAAEALQTSRLKELENKVELERTRLETERVRYELEADQERIRWTEDMEDRIRELRRKIRLQEHEIGYLRVAGPAYLHHIQARATLMKAASMTIPELRLLVYRPLIEDVR